MLTKAAGAAPACAKGQRLARCPCSRWSSEALLPTSVESLGFAPVGVPPDDFSVAESRQHPDCILKRRAALPTAAPSHNASATNPVSSRNHGLTRALSAALSPGHRPGHQESDPTRLRIVDQLREREEISVGELAEVLGASQQNVSKHLAALVPRASSPGASTGRAPFIGSPILVSWSSASRCARASKPSSPNSAQQSAQAPKAATGYPATPPALASRVGVSPSTP